MVDKLLAKTTKIRREKAHINKIRDENMKLQQMPVKYRGLLGYLKTYISINQRI